VVAVRVGPAVISGVPHTRDHTQHPGPVLDSLTYPPFLLHPFDFF
jgi:hypothetical protein